MRLEQGFTARRLAEVLGVSEKAVIWWQVGRSRPQWNNARRLETVLQAPVSVLCAPENASDPGKNAEVAKGNGRNGDHNRVYSE
jgi:DNA-binding XRE family transcriptional regulator